MNALLLFSETGNEPHVIWLLWLLLVLFVIVVLVGWWASNHRPEEEEEVYATPPVHHEAPAAPDDLKKLEGIGPKVAEHLNKMGITTFAQLAEANVDEIQKMLNEAGLQMMNPEGWIMQAKLAAKGDWDALAKLQDELKGGRVVS